MNIGLDAKRVFTNPTGLGVYGRNLIAGFASLPTQHRFTLFAPSLSNHLINFKTLPDNFTFAAQKGPSSYFWRTFGIVNDIRKLDLDIYHGLSNELPWGIEKLQTKTIVDIHDLCFVRFKQDYSWLDRQIFWYKAKHAARVSDHIVATSEATKRDIIELLKVPAEKVSVVYQCCQRSFYQSISSESLSKIQLKYSLPADYVLSVGTIQGRKNQLAIVEALAKLPKDKRLPLVLVGQGKGYLKHLLQRAQDLQVKVHVVSNVTMADLPAIYQKARLFVYPSLVEGFGIPVLEAMASKVPVITTKGTSMAEIIQNPGCLVSGSDTSELSDNMASFLADFPQDWIELAYQRALDFSQEKFAQQILALYMKVCEK